MSVNIEMEYKQFNSEIKNMVNTIGNGNARAIRSLIADKEVEFLNGLIAKNCDLDTIAKAFDSFNGIKLATSSEEEYNSVVSKYRKSIMKRVNGLLISNNLMTYDYVKEIYHDRMNSISNAFINIKSDEKNDELSQKEMERDVTRDAFVISKIMVEQGVSPNVIKELIINDSIHHNNKEYSDKLYDACLQIYTRYSQIKKPLSKENINTPPNIYRYFANKYMKEYNIKMMCAMDEQFIITQMKDVPLSKNSIENVLRELSPIYAEPNRGEEYLNSIIDSIYKESDIVHYSLEDTRNCLVNNINKLNRVTSISDTVALIQAKAIKNLMKNHYPMDYIGESIRKVRDDVELKNNVFAELSDIELNQLIINVQKSLKAEQDILYNKKDIPIPTLPLDITVLKGENISLFDVYAHEIHKRIELNGSVMHRLDEDNFDRDVCESILTHYNNVDEKELADVLKKHSPKALLPGMNENYPNQVVATAKLIIQKTENYNKSLDEFRAEYNMQCGLAKADSYHAIDMYNDGITAIKLLSNNISETDVRSVILMNLDDKKDVGVDKSSYADEIIMKAKECIERMEGIKNFNPKIHESNPVVSRYISEFKDMVNQKNTARSSMDVKIAKNMIADGIPKDKIGFVVSEFSPIACEPGRDENYISFVYESAARAVEVELSKLKNLKLFKSVEKENADDKYMAYKKQIDDHVDLSWQEAMDLLIATAMISDGLLGTDIMHVIMQHSPKCIDMNEEEVNKYAKRVVTTVETNIKEYEKTYDSNSNLVRSRLVSDTTTVDTYTEDI